MGFEPTRAEHIGLAVQRLNHSATSSVDTLVTNAVTSFFYLSFIPCLGILRAVGRNFAALYDKIWTGHGRDPNTVPCHRKP